MIHWVYLRSVHLPEEYLRLPLRILHKVLSAHLTV
ncbi:hypothetical protein FBLNLFFT_0057 [Klebsiella phage Amrap]|uniref:Uncharacterized protein n=1 Tax=Klebsiella phage Amrap TaxID=3018530 RepID=A0AAF0D7Q1_9CAUD|nr:hypothetical protein FBLNLFFT_0057 [Klebsiella phage Amrap]